MARKPASIKTLLAAANKGNAESQLELARRLREDDGVTENLEAAMHWYHKAAEAGNTDAMNDLGSMILNGIGCDADAELAIPWFHEAAQLGNAVAQFNLGLRYLHGSGVDQDDQTAGYWIAQSAKQDYPEALGELGTFYRFGRGTERDLVQACELHIRAAKMGDTCACGNLADYENELVEMALAGNRQIAFALSRMYNGGLGVEQDKAKEWAWLRWAHDGCDPMDEEAAWARKIDDDIADAFKFYLQLLDEEIRIAGETWLANLLLDHGMFGIHLVRPLLVIGAEGDGIELKGRWLPGGWQFFHESASDTCRYNVNAAAGQNDVVTGQAAQHVPSVVIERADSWPDALYLLDRHPWHRLLPIYVHPELAEQVWEAVKQRWQRDQHKNKRNRKRWEAACGKEDVE